ncbi:TetR/AcrR family transcriptional regulator C-terminal domain-containing protein [Streptomyces sp. BHT-5-2]|uniref:TetR/AcrR family transcriptional regulator C-terminal domain-containing protein n=1 Tax=unclassified Streptomyces TaxID=2593676 RepID=UPI001C8D4F31|nr:TetR/AcrR family transcriptional regulator C-terminal domain-containing protein [Streptomyces sp. BHT-5-2]QZL03573.1 TetR/AcrR family transcriptional regulator C-terminal domain-containing protein [Streptomyces sp. BHT-5-2]
MASRIDRDLVVATALRLLNEDGLDGLRLRRIAKELDVQAPALYWHFKNKQELLDEMATEIFRRLFRSAMPAGGPGPDGRWPSWQEMLLHSCAALRRELLTYRDGGKVVAGTRMTDDSFAAPMELFLSHFTAVGFTLEEAARAWWTAYNYTIGLVIEEQSVHPDPAHPEARDPAYDLDARERRLGGTYPLAAHAGRTLFGGTEEAFEAGLRIIVAGIAAEYANHPTRKGR